MTLGNPCAYLIRFRRDDDGLLHASEWRHSLRRDEWNLIASELEAAARRLREGRR